MKLNLESVTKVIKNNWKYKLLSILIAIFVWFIIVQYINPNDTRKINDIKIQINTQESVPAGEGLVLVTDYNETLSLTYKASRDVISILNTDKITAYVDISSATKSGEYNFPVKVDTGGQNITILDQSVTEATLKFEKSSTAQVKVNVSVDGSVPEGYVKNDPVCVPNVINIEGPETKVSKIASAEVKISQKNFTQTSVFNCDYIFVDANGNEISKDYITADYKKVDVTINVLKTKTIPIVATIINSSGGYDSSFIKTTIEPATITVAGGEDTIETLNSYDIGTIDVSERTTNFTDEYVVSLQNGLKNVNSIESVKVNVKFEEIKTKTIKFSQIHVENLAKNQKANVIDKSVSINFRGVSADINKINSSNIKLVVDLNGKEHTKGRNRLSVFAVIPEDYKIGVVGKYQVTVDIS